MLSKTDKNKYRSLLFRHLDGISLLGPISQLSKTGISEFIVKTKSFNLKDISSFKKCNLGYMNISLHLFLCQGWLRKENDTYYKTNNGSAVLQNLSYYAQIYEYINQLVNCNSLIFNKSDSIESITLHLNKVLEKMICQNPEQWIWTHDRWK